MAFEMNFRLLGLGVLLAGFGYAQPSRVVVLVGPPASGKTTQAEYLKKTYGMRIIAADDLIQRNQKEFGRFKNPNLLGVEPRLDPAMNRLVAAELRKIPPQESVVLDGYPSSREQGEALTKMASEIGLPKAVVIILKVPDEVVRKRSGNQDPAILDQKLKDYHREMDFIRTYFPEAALHEVDATKRVKDVSKAIDRILKPAR